MGCAKYCLFTTPFLRRHLIALVSGCCRMFLAVDEQLLRASRQQLWPDNKSVACCVSVAVTVQYFRTLYGQCLLHNQ